MSAAPANGNGNAWSQKYAAILQTITVVALFVGAIWVAVLSPSQSRQDRMEKELLTHIQQQRYNTDQARLNLILDDFEKRGVKIEREVSRLDEAVRNAALRLADMVGRPEHVIKWAGDAQHFERLQADLKELREAFGGSYSIKDALTKQQRDIDDIRARIFTPNGK